MYETCLVFTSGASKDWVIDQRDFWIMWLLEAFGSKSWEPGHSTQFKGAESENHGSQAKFSVFNLLICISKWLPIFIRKSDIHKSLIKYFCQIWSYNFMIEIKVVRNVILNNIDLHSQLSRMHCSLPRSRQKFSDSKNLKNWQIRHRYFRYEHSVFLVRLKVVRNDILNNLYLHDKLPIVHCSPSMSLWSWPNSQIWWFFRSCTVLSNLTVQCFDQNEWCQQCYLQQL